MTKSFDNRPPQPENIPPELAARPQWVVWKLETPAGRDKQTKVPYDARTGGKAASTDSATWATLNDALKAYASGRYSGIGFVFSADDPYAGTDLDGCRDPATGAIEPWAQAVLDRLNSYAEVSPSGTGVKIIVVAQHPGEGFKKDLKNGRAYEMYDAARYFTVTGDILPGSPRSVAERNGEFQALHREVFAKNDTKKTAKPTRQNAALPGDAELLDKARGSKSGGKFSALYDQGWEAAGYPDWSSADFALCGMLSFWAGGDGGRIDSLFRGSALMRPKWDERHGTRTYGQITLDKIVAGTTEAYDPGRGGAGRSAEQIARQGVQAAEKNPPRRAPAGLKADNSLNTVDEQPGHEQPGRDQIDDEQQEAGNTLPDPRKLIRDIQMADDKPPVKRRAISDVVLAYLVRDGQLHRDPDGGLWYFHHERHDLLPVPQPKIDGEEFSSRMALRFGLNRTENFFVYALADVVDAARTLPATSDLRRWSHYCLRTKRLYVSDGNGYMYRLDGRRICRLFNGEDGVLFAAMAGMAPLGNLEELLETASSPEPGYGLMEQILTVNFNDTADMTAAAQAALWYGFVYSLPFESILPTKPIQVFVGEKGRGKSVALKRLSRLLLGPAGNVSPLPPKVEDFDAALYNSRFLWLDNVDSYQPWLMDALACAATGQSIIRRLYYTNMGQISFTPHCFLGVTTREPKFRRDDVADRTLLFTLSRIGDAARVAEHSLMQAIDERRDALFAEYLSDLNQIVAHLQTDTAPLQVGMRLADWGDFFLRFMRLKGNEEAGLAAMAALGQEQMSFSSAGDPLYELLDEWIPEDGGWTPEMNAAELCKALMIRAEEDKREVHLKPHSVGKRLQNSADAITREFEIKQRDGRGRTRFYQFRRHLEVKEEDGESGE